VSGVDLGREREGMEMAGSGWGRWGGWRQMKQMGG